MLVIKSGGREVDMALLDANGRRIRGRGGPPLGELGALQAGGRFGTYPSQGLTPERLSLIFREADAGDIRRQAELFEEMEEKDAHLGSVLQTRKLAVAGLQWEVVPSGGSDGAQEAAAFVREALAGIVDFEDALLGLMEAIGRGFSVCEIVWSIRDGQALVEELRPITQKCFTFIERAGTEQVHDAPRLLTPEAPVYGEQLQANKFIVHHYRGRAGLASRAGILRPCAYMYLFKNYTLKDWVIFNERYAMPMRVGRFGPGTSEADRRTLRQAVFNMGTDAAAVVSDSTVIELLESAGRGVSAEIYEGLVAFCDRSISKAVLGHTGSAESTPGRLGGESEARQVRQDLLEADSKSLARSIEWQLIRPLVQFNLGAGVAPPSLHFRYEVPLDLKALAETYAVLARDVGFRGITAEHIHERFGIPAGEEENA